MTYTDPPMKWPYRGRMVTSCHLTADTLDELHAVALKIGCCWGRGAVAEAGLRAIQVRTGEG